NPVEGHQAGSLRAEAATRDESVRALATVAERGPDIAIVGAGLMGRWPAAAARRLGARVTAAVDANRSLATRLAARYGAAALSDLDALPRAANPRTVAHVCTPLETHVAFSSTLLDRGYQVICEKPVTASAAELERLLEHARMQ